MTTLEGPEHDFDMDEFKDDIASLMEDVRKEDIEELTESEYE